MYIKKSLKPFKKYPRFDILVASVHDDRETLVMGCCDALYVSTIVIAFLKMCMIANLTCMPVKCLFKVNVFLLFCATCVVLIPTVNKV